MSSIRRFLLVSLLATITCVITGAAIYSYFDITRKINSIFDAQLIEAAHVIRYTTEQSTLPQGNNLNELFSPNQTYLPPKLWDTIYGDDLHPYDTRRVFQIWSDDGVLLARTEGAPPYPLAKDVEGFTTSQIGNYTWRVYTLIDEKNHLRYQVAQRNDVRAYLVKNLALGNILPDLLIYPLSIIMIFITIRAAMKPLQRTINDVKNRALQHLEPINTESVPVEIKPLIDEINLLLSRLEESYAREKRFTADAAHELRTPLAALKTQAQVAENAHDETSHQIALNKINLCVDRCARVVTQLLTLSNLRPDEPLKEIQIIDLSKLAVEIISELATDAVHKHITLSFDESKTPAITNGNATLIQVLIRNLIDNAIRYTPEHGQVIVSTHVEKQLVIFCVEDTGPGVAPELYDRIFDRFYRELGNKAQGSGLGLSIVQQIVELHGATIKVSKPGKHSGLKIQVFFPNQN
ncbi:MAG: ATP-binding protein [Legionellales bacterium]|jgi:two-component system sensor histidine kinase QseC